jgi:arsenate reductase (glutaredoxin)
MSLKVYFNPRCSKCRIARSFLNDNNKEYDLYEYLEKGISVDDLKEILAKSDLKISDIIRKNEDEYKEYIRGKPLSEDEILNLIVKHPRLLQRPIILNKDSAIVARDEDSLDRVKDLK